MGGGFEWVIFFSFSFLFFSFVFVCVLTALFFSTQDSTSTYPNNYHGDHLRIRIPRTVQSNMRGRSCLGSFRSELGIGEIDAQGTCGGSGADMDWCACFYCGEKLVLGGSFFLLVIFPLPSFSLFMSLTYLQRNQAHQESLREILHPRPCVLMDNRQMYSKAGFFYTFVTSVIFLLSSPSLSPSPPKRQKKRKKQLTKTNGTTGPNRPLSQTPPTAIAQTVASKTN